jgi:hypothetical protein
MSFYKQIFATASIFAIAATALITPSATAYDVNISASNSSGYTFCTKPATTGGNSYKANDGYSTIVTTANGTSAGVSEIYVSNTSDVKSYSTPSGTLSDTNPDYSFLSNLCVSPSVLTIPTVSGHKTTYDLENNGTTTASTGVALSFTDNVPSVSKVVAKNIKIKNTNPGSANVVKSCEGDKTVFTISGTEGDLIEFVSTTIPSADFDVSNSSDNPLKVTVNKRSSTSVKATGVYIYFKEKAASPIAPATYDVTQDLVNIVTDIELNCVATVASSSVSSSSMMSSTPAVATSAAASATAVVSSAKATVEVDAPSTAKGTSTVRTGGAY